MGDLFRPISDTESIFLNVDLNLTVMKVKENSIY